MKIDKYLQTYQPIIYQIFLNSLKEDKLSHAYLISGEQGMPLKDIALYFAKTLICENPSPLACDSCINCMRADEGNYVDLRILDGEEGTIKKEQIKKLLESFSLTAVEEKGVLIYIINLVETIKSNVVHSILKFLEEPGKNVYAFLTTQNESMVLPTIISRTQVLRLRRINQDKILENCLEIGVLNEDAELLTCIYNDPDKIKEISTSAEYLNAKAALMEQLNSLAESKDQAVYTCEHTVLPLVKDMKTCILYLKLLSQVLQELLNIQVNRNITIKSYDTILHALVGKIEHVDKSLLMIMNMINKIGVQSNIGLVLDHVIFEIVR